MYAYIYIYMCAAVLLLLWMGLLAVFVGHFAFPFCPGFWPMPHLQVFIGQAVPPVPQRSGSGTSFAIRTWQRMSDWVFQLSIFLTQILNRNGNRLSLSICLRTCLWHRLKVNGVVPWVACARFSNWFICLLASQPLRRCLVMFEFCPWQIKTSGSLPCPHRRCLWWWSTCWRRMSQMTGPAYCNGPCWGWASSFRTISGKHAYMNLDFNLQKYGLASHSLFRYKSYMFNVCPSI